MLESQENGMINETTDLLGLTHTVRRNGYLIQRIAFAKFAVEVVSKEVFIVEAHLEAIEWIRKNWLQMNLFDTLPFRAPSALEKLQDRIVRFLRFKDWSMPDRFFDFEAWEEDLEKFNKELEKTEGKWIELVDIMPKEEDKEVEGEIRPCVFSDLIAANPDFKKFQEMVQKSFDNFCILTIITKGFTADGKETELKTEINLNGDIVSFTNLSGQQLSAYHERMQTVSVDLIKTYIQVLIQIVGIILPFANLGRAGSDALKSITEIVKAFSVKATEATP
jgi:hypothetical protein